MMICPAFAIVLSLSFRLYLVLVNKRRDRRAGSPDAIGYTEPETGIQLNLTDKTDMEMPQFRYVY